MIGQNKTFGENNDVDIELVMSVSTDDAAKNMRERPSIHFVAYHNLIHADTMPSKICSPVDGTTPTAYVR